MLSKISNTIWKLNVDSNIYMIDLKEPIVIDTGPFYYKKQVKHFLGKIIPSDLVKTVIFTHLHADHSSNYDLFENADFFASKQEIKDFKKDPRGATLTGDISHYSALMKKIKPVKNLGLKNFKVIKTPGHTKGSICLFYKPESVLFSGDTLFQNGYGRIDLPTSDPNSMRKSLKKLKKIKYKILALGHDY